MSAVVTETKAPKTSRDWDMAAIAPFVALALLLVLGYFANPNFVSLANLTNVITRSAFIAVIALGATYVISAGGLDLSVGAMVAFVASLMILFMNSGVIADPMLMLMAGMAVALVLGAACGLANGLITTLGRIEPFIATLGTMGIYRGLTTWLSQGGAITLKDRQLQQLYRPVYFGDVFGVPIPIIVIFVTAALAAFVLYRTRYGRHVIAVGSNEEVARYSGISVNKVRTIAYVVQGLCVAVAVIIYVPRLGSTSATTGILWELQAITAVVVGGTSLMGGVGTITGTIIGSLIIGVINNILNLLNVSSYWQQIIKGLIIAIAVILDVATKSKRRG